MSKHLMIVMTNPDDGREREFNEWYTNTHIRDVLKIPGIVSAQRYALSSAQRMPMTLPWRYFAIYEIETDDIAATMKTLTERSGTALLPVSDLVHGERHAVVIHAISEKVTAGSTTG